MGGVADLLTVEDALARVLSHARALPAEDVPLGRSAGMIIAAAAEAAVDLPPFSSSAMDGFALRAADTPGTLRVELRVAAGRPATRPLEAGEAMGIATGGLVPEGADAVIPLELVRDRGTEVDVERSVPLGANIRETGGDARRGEVIVEQGALLAPHRLAALAATGIATVRCHRRPRVAILTTGTELRPPGEVLEPGQIYESNGVMLESLFQNAGAEVRRLHTAVDTLVAHRAALVDAFADDVVVTSGGVSVGPHDLVRRVAQELGAEEVFWGVAVRPGKPLSFAVRGETLVFGLPGNPVSSLVGAILFVLPALRRLQGLFSAEPAFQAGTSTLPLARNATRDDFVRARLDRGSDGAATLTPVVGQDSHMIARAAAADALVHVPRGDGAIAPGAPVRYLALASSGA